MRRAGHDEVCEVRDRNCLRIGRRLARRKRRHRGRCCRDTAKSYVVLQVSDDLVRDCEVAGAEVDSSGTGEAPIKCQRAVMSPSLQHRKVSLVAEVPYVDTRLVGGERLEGAVDGVVVKAGERTAVSDGSNHCGFARRDRPGPGTRAGRRIVAVAGIGGVVADAVDVSALAALVITYDGAALSGVDVSGEVAVNACRPVDGVGAACVFHCPDQSAVSERRPADACADDVRMRDDPEEIIARHDSSGDAAGDGIAD